MKKVYVALFIAFIAVTSFVLAPQKNDQPNILFIEVDDLTAKYLGCFGAEFSKTPNVDALAENGVVFENAICQGVMCGPSRNSLIAAMYPHNLGFYENVQLPALPKDSWTFPKALQGEGYETFWVGKNHVRPDQSGIKAANAVEKKNKAMQSQMGFDHVYQSAGRVVVLKTAKKQIAKGKGWKTGKDAYGDFLNEQGVLEKFVEEKGKLPTTLDEDTQYMDGHFTTTAIEQMKNYEGDAPFFMWVNFSCPHGPFDVPQKYHDMFEAADMPAIIDPTKETFTFPDALKPLHNLNHKKAKGTAKMRAEYSATIAYMDKQVGRLMNFLNSSEFADNTVIVFFSDHGLMTGDHGLIHKSNLFKEVLNASLIISYPKEYKAKRVSAPAELLDLGKTVLDIAGASHATLDAAPNGYSLLPLLKGKGKFERPGVAFAEIEGYRAAFDGKYKYIDNETMPILFNLEKDPDETINAIEKEKKVAETLKQAVDNWIAETGEIKEAGFYDPEKKYLKKKAKQAEKAKKKMKGGK